jgi:hypothetical protein
MNRLPQNIATCLVLMVHAWAVEKPKVFVTTNTSWQANGAGGEQKVSGGGDADTAEVIKLFSERCPVVTVNMRLDKADYIVLAKDDGSGGLRRGRKIVVSNPDGDVLFTKADRSFGGVVKDACKAMATDWSSKTR